MLISHNTLPAMTLLTKHKTPSTNNQIWLIWTPPATTVHLWQAATNCKEKFYRTKKTEKKVLQHGFITTNSSGLIHLDDKIWNSYRFSNYTIHMVSWGGSDVRLAGSGHVLLAPSFGRTSVHFFSTLLRLYLKQSDLPSSATVKKWRLTVAGSSWLLVHSPHPIVSHPHSPRPRKEKTHCTTAAVCSLLWKGTFRGAKWAFMFSTSKERQSKALQLRWWTRRASKVSPKSALVTSPPSPQLCVLSQILSVGFDLLLHIYHIRLLTLQRRSCWNRQWSSQTWTSHATPTIRHWDIGLFYVALNAF